MNVSTGAEDKTWREPKDDVIQVGKPAGSCGEEVRYNNNNNNNNIMIIMIVIL